MLVEMVSYIKDVQDRKKLGGLKEIKESPKFNFDKPLTAPDEMDEAFILDGGQLSNKELKEELLKKGHIFKTNTDTEVILHGYEEYKEEFQLRQDVRKR